MVALTAAPSAAGAATGPTETTSKAAGSASPETLSLAGAIALILMVLLCGRAIF